MKALIVSVVLLASTLGAPPAVAAAAVTPPTQPFLMAFHSCPPGTADCNDPRNHVVQLAQSSDGAAWRLLSGWQPFAGSVPDAYRRGDTIYVYSTSGVAKVNAKTGAVTASQPVAFSDGTTYVDPSLAQLPDGRLIMFYLPGQPGMDPATCGTAASCVREIRSAVEVAGSDGLRFTPDSTPRVSMTLTSGAFSDPDIFTNGREWVLYVSRGQSTAVYSADGLQDSFVPLGDVSVGQGGVPAGLLNPNTGQVMTYVFNGTEILRATSPTGVTLLNGQFTPAVTGATVGPGVTQVASPGVGANTAGTSCASCTPAPATIRCRKGDKVKVFTGTKCPKGWRPVRR